MSGCAGGLVKAASGSAEEEGTDCRPEPGESFQEEEERPHSEENDNPFIDTNQSGVTWVKAAAPLCEWPEVQSAGQVQEDPADAWDEDGPTPLTLMPPGQSDDQNPWEYGQGETIQRPIPQPGSLTTSTLRAKLIQVVLNPIPCPVSAPLDMVRVHKAEPPGCTNCFLVQCAAAMKDLVRSLEVLHNPERQRLKASESPDSEVLLGNRTTLGSLDSMGQLDRGTGGRGSPELSLPSLWNERGRGNRSGFIRATDLCKTMTPNTSVLATPQLTQSASGLQPLLGSSPLLRVRAQIYTRLRGRKPEMGNPGRKGLSSFLSPTPDWTSKVLVPLDKGFEEGGMNLTSRGLRPLKPIAPWPTDSASRARRQRWSKQVPQAPSVIKGDTEDSSSSNVSSLGSLDFKDPAELSETLPDQREQLDAKCTVIGPHESYGLALPASFIDDCSTSRPNLEPECPNKNQGSNEQATHDNIRVIYCTKWMDDSKGMPRGAEAEFPHITAPVSPGKTQKCCDIDLATPPGLSCEQVAQDKAKYSEVLTKEYSGPEEWQSDPAVPEKNRDFVGVVCNDEGQLECSMLQSKQHVLSVNTAASTEQLTEENHKRSKVFKNKNRDRCSSNLTNQSFSLLAQKKHNTCSRKSKRNTPAPAQKPANARRPPDVAVDGESNLKVGLQCTKAAKPTEKTTLLPLLSNKRVQLIRENTKQSSAGERILTRCEGQWDSLQCEPRSIQQPKRSGMLGTLGSKSAIEYVTYSDMFQEINSQGEGPAIYEMFATPVYKNLRTSTSCERVPNREVKSAPPRKNQGEKNSKCPKTLENKPHKTQRGKSTGKRKRRLDIVPRGMAHQLLINDAERENTIFISDVDCHIQATKAEMIFHEGGKESDPWVTPEQHVENSALSVIEEVFTDHLTETPTFHCTPKNRAVSTLVEVVIPLVEKINPASTTPQNTEYKLLVPKNPIVEDPDENRLKVEITEEKLMVRAQADEVRSVSYPAQATVCSWISGDSSRTVSPVFQKFLDAADEGAMTDDLLRCLAEELISLEEKEVTLQPENSDSCTGEIVHASLIEKSIASPGRTCSASSLRSDDTISWTKGEVLGKGAYGTVYCGLTSQGQLIAVKQVALDDSDPTSSEKEYQRLQDEVELLKTLCHTNIVSFLGTTLQDNVVSIFMEYVPGGSIASILRRFGPLPERVLALYTKQILEGVAYLHRNRVIHRDLKGNNVMLMPTGIVKLIDFGCARRLGRFTHNTDHSELLKSVHGTPYWMAPEVINETGHGRKSDIWSVGCTVFEMATGKPPLAHMDKMAALFYIGAQKGLMPVLPDRFSKEARDFVQACLTSDQKVRPSANQLLAHPFVRR